MLFHCNYDIKEMPHISSKFYSELLQWWSEFRSVFDSRRECQYILWNNKEIHVDNKPFFYKKCFEQDIIFITDLLFEVDTTNSFTIVSNKTSKINYLIWVGLCHSVPKHLKKSTCFRSEISLILTIDNKEFDILKKTSKDNYYMLIKRIIAPCPKNSKPLCQDFSLTQDQLKKLFLLPHAHEVAFKPYLKAFQYKVLNSILFTNKKLCKIGYIQDDKCSLCKTDSESLYLIFFECMQTHQAVLEKISILLLPIDKRIRLSNLTRCYYRNIIYKLPVTELYDADC